MKATTTDPVRSATMRAAKSKDTTPEMMVRRLVHRLGCRYWLHRKDPPGKPDLVFGRRKVIMVNGCFWHGHDCAPDVFIDTVEFHPELSRLGA